MQKRARSILLTMLFCTVLFLMSVPAASAEPIDEIRSLIKNYYVDEVPESVLQQKTGKDMTEKLDPHTVYFHADEFELFMNAIEQRIVGIGIVLEEHTKGIRVVSILPDSPAERAGLAAGDLITHIEGKSLKGMPSQTAMALIGGKKGTKVNLTIERKNVSEPIQKVITRDEIHLPVVEQERLGGNIGYLRISSFSMDTAKEMNRAIRSLKDVDSWIIDLRDNGGGFITAAQDVVGFFPSIEHAFQIQGRDRKPILYKAIPQPQKIQQPTALLINGYSASASEMVAAALKDQQAAKLFGQTTYGKGTMQAMHPFDDGSVLKLTEARFFSPKGKPIDQVGVQPDVVTRLGEELVKAHRDLLIARHKNYRELPKITNVPTTKSFEIQLNTKMDRKRVKSDAVQLIELGGDEVPVDVRVKNEKTIVVTPKQELLPDGRYLLLIHPQWVDVQGNKVSRGIYVDIHVKNK